MLALVSLLCQSKKKEQIGIHYYIHLMIWILFACCLFPSRKKDLHGQNLFGFSFFFFKWIAIPLVNADARFLQSSGIRRKLRNRIKKGGEEEAIGYWNKMWITSRLMNFSNRFPQRANLWMPTVKPIKLEISSCSDLLLLLLHQQKSKTFIFPGRPAVSALHM